MSGFDDKINKLNSYKATITEEIKNTKTEKLQAQEGAAEWMINNGIEKLHGAYCSSITITKGKPESTKEEKKIQYVYNGVMYTDDKLLLGELVKDGIIDLDELIITKPVAETKDKVRINNKR